MRVEECELAGLQDGLKKDYFLCERKQCEGQDCLGVLIHSDAFKAYVEIVRRVLSLLTLSINIIYFFMGTFWWKPCSNSKPLLLLPESFSDFQLGFCETVTVANC